MMSDVMCDMMAEMMSDMIQVGLLSNSNIIEYDNCVITQLNDCIKTRSWSKSKEPTSILQYWTSNPRKTHADSELVKPIKFGEEEWNTLKQAKTNDIHPILSIVHLVAKNGDKGTVVRLMQHDSFTILVELYKNTVCEQQMCLILFTLLYTSEYIDYGNIVKEIIPIFPRVAYNMKLKNILKNQQHMYCSIRLIYEAVKAGTENEVRQMLDFDIVSVLTNVLEAIEKSSSSWEVRDQVAIWRLLTWVLLTIMRSKNGKLDDIFPGILGHLITLRNSQFSEDMECLSGSNILISFTVSQGDKWHWEAMIKANFISTIVNLVKDVHVQLTNGLKIQPDTYHVYKFVIVSAVESINRIIVTQEIDVVINVVNATLAIVPCIINYMLTIPDDYAMSHLAVSLFNFMICHGKTKDMKTMLEHDVLTTILKVLERHPDDLERIAINVVAIVYHMVMQVDDSKSLKQQLLPYKRFFIACFKRWERSVLEYNIVNRAAYIAVAMADFVKDDDPLFSQDILGKMASFFDKLYKNIRSDFKRPETTPITVNTLEIDMKFMINTMFKHKMLQPTVLHHAWFILKYGSDEYQIAELFHAIKALSAVTDGCSRIGSKDENDGKISLEDKKAEALNFVMSKTKDIIEEQHKYSRLELIRITQFLIEISHDDANDDQTIFWLEDMVSPCLGVLQNREDKTIIKNIKQFITNLHY